MLWHCRIWYRIALLQRPVPEKHDTEQHSGQGQRAAKARIEDSDKYVRHKAGAAQPDTAAHHECHNQIGLPVEKMPDRFCFLRIAFNALGVLYAHLVKHETKEAKHKSGEQDVYNGN